MNYSKYFILIQVTIVIGSCIEELDPLEPSFEKVYGFNGNSSLNGISKNADGSFLIYGWAEEP